MRYSTAPKRAVEFFIQLDKLLFGDVLNSDIIVGDGKPVPYGEKWRLLGFKFQFVEQFCNEKLTEMAQRNKTLTLRSAPGGGPGEGGFEIGLPTLEKRGRTERFHDRTEGRFSCPIDIDPIGIFDIRLGCSIYASHSIYAEGVRGDWTNCTKIVSKNWRGILRGLLAF